MNVRDRLYHIWAPPASPWAAWAKPVLFAHAPKAVDGHSPTVPVDYPAMPSADGATAVVVDLPGPAGVSAAVALAGIGYRPVPLYNAVPTPPGVPAAVEVGPIAAALVAAAADLSAADLPHDAAPAFLLDSGRRFARVAVGPGMFDNRSVSLPTDFPSADRLRAAGVQRVILIQAADTLPQSDLIHTLRRWQEAGLPILRYAADMPDRPPSVIPVARPGGFRSMWHGLLAMAGLRRYPLGGFGGMLPIPSAG